ncbi:putative Rossmann fold nucleotide-binding protein DprA/Smf involved in DNA uptake [Streptosporangium becharense]|uniref:Putative Rossmann fold nucleotide-binding protein DprA/Smf involved in DNA uptake n=1 Tax=Streptosporangium becharense TaxID=1816182 RepID=A0A7W9IJ50_9ACTN|nr:hypothetical protein [Streptosporangium becharense]MBB2911270.1 putative Rossmann fold nucleotide-binding protein DprA/Smf involved in DNA uptake [Streptosporangium becharense]MBB5821672.1 putative Rossmann fold nucleotide-binding protein DprA/Smf involved in DNA uptake [Streptosporangium becharense]
MLQELRERAALVALLQRPGAKWQDIALDVLGTGSAVTVLERELRPQDALFPETDPVVSAVARAAESLAAWEVAGIGIHACFDNDYPSQLRSIHQMPPLLFSRGALIEDPRDSRRGHTAGERAGSSDRVHRGERTGPAQGDRGQRPRQGH